MRTIWVLICICGCAALPAQRVRSETERSRPEGPAVQLSEMEAAWLKSHPQVRWGSDPNWPPFSSRGAEGRLMGIDADLTFLVAERVGLSITVVPATSWSELLAKAKAGEVDFLSGTAEISRRLETFDYTAAYAAFPVVIVTRADGPFLTMAADLRSRTVSMPRDYVVTLQLQRDFPTARFILTDTAEDALKLVSHLKADATVQNLAVATRVIRLDGLTNLKIAGITAYEFPLRFAVRKDAPELTAILNKGLATITRQEQEKIYAAHLVPDIARARDWGAWRRRALYTAAIGGMAVAGVVFWNCYLSRQIQRRKAAEAELREARAGLEQRAKELDRRIGEVERLNGELKTANQDLDSFSSSVSHDLRAPVRRVTTFAQLLQVQARDSISDKGRETLSIIIDEAKGMDRLINDLLEFARVGRTTLYKQSVNMRELVRNVIKDFASQTRDRKVTWEIGELGAVSGDPNLLHYAMTNLIDNALKYTSRCEEARIQIDVLSEGPGQQEAVLYVRDNGCGFDMKDAKDLFSPFKRLHSRQDYEGTGIGLATVQRIILRHGGRIWFESEPNKGATFCFTIARVSP